MGCDAHKKMHIDSRVVSARLPPINTATHGEPLTVPIYNSSVFRNTSTQQYTDIVKNGGYIYQRLGNPTNETAELIINEMERGAGTIVYNSGLAAVNAVLLCFLKAGDHIVCQGPCYSGTAKFIGETLTRFGVTVTWVLAGSDISAYEKAITKNTKLLLAETPGNPTMAITDLSAFGALGAKHNVLTVVDGTFASPIAQQPITHGVDFSVHSCSKYMGGHTDLIAGCVTVAKIEHWTALKEHLATTGSTLSAMDASMLIRGLKTLPLRLPRHSDSAMKVATFLEGNKKVKCVYYPGLASHPQHKLAMKQMQHTGGMICFEMKTKEAAKTVVEACRLINLAVSLGGTESLIEHPATMTHGPLFMAKGDDSHVCEGLIRLSIGLEHADDLISDLAQALEKVHE
jgi:cystathionine beta-lyase/cystathionine gamma-synthase